VHDALRFIAWSRLGLQEAPLQVYYGALVFALERSLMRQQYRQEMPAGARVKRGLDGDWDALLQTLEGHTSYVTSVVFLADGNRLASASRDETVRVWDAKTGQVLHTFKRVGYVRSVAFTTDSLCLHTDKGTLLLPRSAISASTSSPQAPAKTISISER
jgi:hypothetical protein